MHKDLKDLDRAKCSETKMAALGRGDEKLHPSTRVLTVLARISKTRRPNYRDDVYRSFSLSRNKKIN